MAAPTQSSTLSDDREEAHPSKPRGHVTTEQLLRQERKKAASFIDNVVQGRAPAPPREEPQPVASPPLEMCERQKAFQELLHNLLFMNESMVEEDGLLEQVNGSSMQSRDDKMQFTADECSRFLKILSEEGKIMQTDGMIIFI